MRLSLSLATFCQPNSLFALYSFQPHVHIHHRKDYDEDNRNGVRIITKLANETQNVLVCESIFES